MTITYAKRVYFKQYGTIWSLSRQAVKALAEQAANGQGYDLDDFGKQLKSSPSPWHTINHCLDWDQDDWRNFTSEIRSTT